MRIEGLRESLSAATRGGSKDIDKEGRKDLLVEDKQFARMAARTDTMVTGLKDNSMVMVRETLVN